VAIEPKTEIGERVTSRAFVIGLIVITLVAGLVGYAIGSGHAKTQERHGTAYVGNRMASIRSGNRYYGVEASVPWFDRSGTFHDDGWPSCLGEAGGEVPVTFGLAPVSPPNAGLTFGAVTFIDCRPGQQRGM